LNTGIRQNLQRRHYCKLLPSCLKCRVQESELLLRPNLFQVAFSCPLCRYLPSAAGFFSASGVSLGGKNRLLGVCFTRETQLPAHWAAGAVARAAGPNHSVGECMVAVDS